VHDTQRVVELVARRELGVGVVGAARRRAPSRSRPSSATRSCSSAAASPFAGRTLTLEELRGEPLILMQAGAGVRAVIEEELRAAGLKLKDFDVHLELGLQESVKSAVVAGYGVTFISRSAIESELAAGTLAVARVQGLEPAREISLVRSAGRAPSRVADAFLAFARERL
jgi:DNA-binding transcriptional LysR family regulator